MPKRRIAKGNARSLAQKRAQQKAAEASARARRKLGGDEPSARRAVARLDTNSPNNKRDVVALKEAVKGSTARGKLSLAASAKVGRENVINDADRIAYRASAAESRRLKVKLGDNAPTADKIFSTAKKIAKIREGSDEVRVADTRKAAATLDPKAKTPKEGEKVNLDPSKRSVNPDHRRVSKASDEKTIAGLSKWSVQDLRNRLESKNTSDQLKKAISAELDSRSKAEGGGSPRTKPPATPKSMTDDRLRDEIKKLENEIRVLDENDRKLNARRRRWAGDDEEVAKIRERKKKGDALWDEKVAVLNDLREELGDRDSASPQERRNAKAAMQAKSDLKRESRQSDPDLISSRGDLPAANDAAAWAKLIGSKQRREIASMTPRQRANFKKQLETSNNSGRVSENVKASNQRSIDYIDALNGNKSGSQPGTSSAPNPARSTSVTKKDPTTGIVNTSTTLNPTEYGADRSTAQLMNEQMQMQKALENPRLKENNPRGMRKADIQERLSEIRAALKKRQQPAKKAAPSPRDAKPAAAPKARDGLAKALADGKAGVEIKATEIQEGDVIDLIHEVQSITKNKDTGLFEVKTKTFGKDASYVSNSVKRLYSDETVILNAEDKKKSPEAKKAPAKARTDSEAKRELQKIESNRVRSVISSLGGSTASVKPMDDESDYTYTSDGKVQHKEGGFVVVLNDKPDLVSLRAKLENNGFEVSIDEPNSAHPKLVIIPKDDKDKK